MPVHPYAERDRLFAVLIGVRMKSSQYQKVCDAAQRRNCTVAAVMRGLIDQFVEEEEGQDETALEADVERALD